MSLNIQLFPTKYLAAITGSKVTEYLVAMLINNDLRIFSYNNEILIIVQKNIYAAAINTFIKQLPL